MISDEAVLTHNKILGVLLRKTRLDADVSPETCAQALSCDPEFITRVELGQESLTLPQLESLAHVLHVPLSFFLDEGASLKAGAAEPIPYDNLMLVRRKLIGVVLRQARSEAGQSLDELALSVGVPPEYLAGVELGEAQIPLVQLQVLADTLGIPITEFVSEEAALSAPEKGNGHEAESLGHLPAEIREFIQKPINIPYLQIAMNLSQMPAETLRQIASGLLEITY